MEINLHFDCAPKKMYGQSLVRGEEKPLDLSIYLTDKTINIPQTLLEELNTVSDNSDNAVMFRFEF